MQQEGGDVGQSSTGLNRAPSVARLIKEDMLELRSQALGGNKIVLSLPGGGSIALVKINVRNVSVEISLKNVCLPSVCVKELMSA